MLQERCLGYHHPYPRPQIQNLLRKCQMPGVQHWDWGLMEVHPIAVVLQQGSIGAVLRAVLGPECIVAELYMHES